MENKFLIEELNKFKKLQDQIEKVFKYNQKNSINKPINNLTKEDYFKTLEDLQKFKEDCEGILFEGFLKIQEIIESDTNGLFSRVISKIQKEKSHKDFLTKFNTYFNILIDTFTVKSKIFFSFF